MAVRQPRYCETISRLIDGCDRRLASSIVLGPRGLLGVWARDRVMILFGAAERRQSFDCFLRRRAATVYWVDSSSLLITTTASSSSSEGMVITSSWTGAGVGGGGSGWRGNGCPLVGLTASLLVTVLLKLTRVSRPSSAPGCGVVVVVRKNLLLPFLL